MGIGRRIKEARERAGLTQEELGKLVGVTGSAITNYEKETSHPKEPVMYALIDVLKVDANFLFQDCVSTVKIKNAPSISDEALMVARAYEAADPGIRYSVRKLLDINQPLYLAAARNGMRVEFTPNTDTTLPSEDTQLPE